jgi:hypothetical protein
MPRHTQTTCRYYDNAIGALDENIIRPAEVRFAELLARKAEKMKGEHV